MYLYNCINTKTKWVRPPFFYKPKIQVKDPRFPNDTKLYFYQEIYSYDQVYIKINDL